jgi:CheY-like chemotaxis protein
LRVPQTVLVVDYDLWGRRRLAAALGESGYTVVEASNGASGLRLAESHQPQVIVLGNSLPEMRTEVVIDRLRDSRATRDIPVLRLAGRQSDEHEHRSQTALLGQVEQITARQDRSTLPGGQA